MTITYEYFKSLYVNITNRCSNACTFCVRNNHDDVNGKDNLWLEHEPTIDEIKADFETRDLSKYDAIVFCGYGEPTERIDDVVEISKWLKHKNKNIKIRINTNGQTNLIANRDVTSEFKDVIDCVSISLNAENADKYQILCRSRFGGDAAFEGLQDFARLEKKTVPEVIFTVVDIMPKDEIEECRKIAENCGVKFRVRKYIK
ncbi:MAG: TIGR04100 family radical SAM protein [Oscillospiraceae bacterium]